MEDFKYISEVFGSLKEVFKKPVLLMPFLYLLILGVVFAFFTPNYATPPPGELPPTKDLISMTILFLAQVLISLIFYGMGLVGMRMHIDGETVTCKNQASKGIKIYWKLLLQKVYLFMIFFLPAIALMLIYAPIQGSKMDVGVVGLIGLILILAFIVYLIAMSLFYMFSTVIIAYDGKSAIISLRESHKYFKEDMAHAVLTFFSILLFVVISLVVILLVSVPLILLAQTQIVMFFQNLIMYLIVLPVSATITLYLFKSYNYGLNNREPKVQIKADVVPAAKKEVIKEVAQPSAVAAEEEKKNEKEKIVPAEVPSVSAKPPVKPKPVAKPAAKSKPVAKPSKPVAKPAKK